MFSTKQYQKPSQQQKKPLSWRSQPPPAHYQAPPTALPESFNRRYSTALSTLDHLFALSKAAKANWRVQSESRSLRVALTDYHRLICRMFLAVKREEREKKKKKKNQGSFNQSAATTAEQQRNAHLASYCRQLAEAMRHLVETAIGAVRSEWKQSPPATFAGAVARTAEMLALRATADAFCQAAKRMRSAFWCAVAEV